MACTVTNFPVIQERLDKSSRPSSNGDVRLNLGGGEFELDGFVNLDRKHGTEVYPLSLYTNESVTEIYASHVLEHFGHREVDEVLTEWVRVLKIGGRIRIAVPDFDYICKGYLDGKKEPFGSYVMGGQLDQDDYHKTVFNEERLTILMEQAGLRDIKRWKPEIEDCASMPVSLNLEGVKGKIVPKRPLPAVQAVMSMPRLAFSDNMFCALGVVDALRIPFERVTGVFWGQCLERIIEPHITGGEVEFIMTVDYDTIFTPDHVRQLCALMQDNPRIDALAPIQVKREEDAFLMGVLKDDGSRYPEGKPITMDVFKPDLTRASWAHFGLTLFRVSALKSLPHPWFLAVPNKEGRWGEGRLDDDLYFWRHWQEHGKTLYLANRVPVGHAQLMISWPSEEGGVVYQWPTQFNHGKQPVGVWK